MKKIRRILLVTIVFFLIPTFANASSTYQDFQMQMPETVQAQLSQGSDWKTVEVSETEQHYVLLLYGKAQNSVNPNTERKLAGNSRSYVVSSGLPR